MRVQHTPGPWRLDNPLHAHVLADDYHAIDGGAGFHSNDGKPGLGIAGFMSLADARLIAAAPTMFQTLSDMDGWLANTGYAEDHPWRLSLRAAMATATGSAA